MMAVDDKAKTSDLARKNGRRPNSSGMNFNNIDSGRETLRNIVLFYVNWIICSWCTYILFNLDFEQPKVFC